jgi:hypothetical protein
VIAWALPAAFAGLFLLAGPVLVHMLLRRNARRVVFPTSRFFAATQAAAVRFQRPSDIGLLVLRCAIVLTAVLAAAQPIVFGVWRTRAWNGRSARAVVLDTSRSMPSAAEAGRLADQEMAAFASERFAAADLRDALSRAADWIARTPPARREIVVISDFQRGTLDRDALAAVPAGVGLRFIRAGRHPEERDVPLPVIAGWRGGAWQGAATIRGDAIEASWTRRGASIIEWVGTRQARGDEPAARRAVAGAASFGIAPAPAGRRAVVAYAGAEPVAGDGPVATDWMLRAELAIRRSDLLRQTGATITTAEQADALVVHVSVGAADPMAAAVARAVMLALSPAAIVDRELEVATIPDAELAGWRRDPAPVTNVTAVPRGIVSDARWLWGLALLLLAVETWVRRSRAGRSAAEGEVTAHAA